MRLETINVNGNEQAAILMAEKLYPLQAVNEDLKQDFPTGLLGFFSLYSDDYAARGHYFHRHSGRSGDQGRGRG